MHSTSPIAALSVLALAGLAVAAPVSQNGTALTARDTIDCDCPADDECYYGDQLTLDDYTAYLRQYYPATDHYVLYSANSEDQVTSFQQAGNTDYFYYNDFFDFTTSKNYLTQWPAMKDSQGRGYMGNCYRMDDGDASSIAIATVAAGEILVFGAVEYLTQGQTSWFATKEAPALRTNINGGTLNKITHMQGGATAPDQVLATEDANENIMYLNGQSGPNASGTYGDCSSTDKQPTCDNPSGNADIHE